MNEFDACCFLVVEIAGILIAVDEDVKPRCFKILGFIER
jgi:hypothetical protein